MTNPQRQSVDTPEYEDAFGRPVQLNIQNVVDLAGHYDYSPERYRVFVNGSRQQIQYGSVTEFEDTVDSFLLKPQSNGDVVTMETAEIFRYAVQYVIEWSAAAQVNQPLQSGDAVTLAYGDADLENSGDDTPGPSADGWMFVKNSSLDSDEIRISQYRAGTRQDTTVVSGVQGLESWIRRAAEVNYYSVGASDFEETYTSFGTQLNETVGSTSKDGGKGPEIGNHPVQLSVKAGSSGAGSFELEVGSIGVRTLGDIEPIVRPKAAAFTATIDTTGSFVALDAIRTDPDRDLVTTKLRELNVLEYSADDDVVILAQSFAQSKLADSGGNDIVDADFSAPTEHSTTGSVIQTTSAVDQFPDETGTVGTLASNPGGHQVGYGSLYTSGKGSKTSQTQGIQQVKRPVSERDIVVFLGKSGTMGDVTIEYSTTQQW